MIKSYTFMPEIIKFYLGEESKLPSIRTWRCSKPLDRKYVLSNLKKLVVKESMVLGVMECSLVTMPREQRLRCLKKD